SKYRLMGSAGWGIAINISAEWSALDDPPNCSTRIADGVWFKCEDDRLDADELRNLMLGVKMESQAIANKKPAGKSVLIKILEVEFNPTDYQPEGLVAASANWAAEAFGFAKPEIIGIYDKERRKYIFSFDPRSESQTDEAESAAEPIQD